MKFFERFKPTKPRTESKDPVDFNRAHQELIDAAKSYNSTLAEVAVAKKQPRKKCLQGFKMQEKVMLWL